MPVVAEYESASWFTEDAATAAVTCAEGDVLVASAVCGNQLRVLGVSGGGLVWTAKGGVSATSRCSIGQWTAVVGPGQGGSFNVTATFSGDGAGGLSVIRASGVAVGNHAVGDATGPAGPTLNLTTTGTDSIVVVAVGDHSTVDGAARAWRNGAGALTETTYWRTNFENAAYVGYHAAAGAAGVKAVGLTAPNMRYSIAAVELVPAGGVQVEFATSLTPPTFAGQVEVVVQAELDAAVAPPQLQVQTATTVRVEASWSVPAPLMINTGIVVGPPGGGPVTPTSRVLVGPPVVPSLVHGGHVRYTGGAGP